MSEPAQKEQHYGRGSWSLLVMKEQKEVRSVWRSGDMKLKNGSRMDSSLVSLLSIFS